MRQDLGRRDVLSQIVFPTRGPAVSDPVTYTAVLPVAEDTVQFVSALLAADRRRRRTRPKRRALGCYRQAVLVLRWFLDGTRLAQLAADNDIGRSTTYRYLHEGIDVLADRAPGLRGALLAARAAGHPHVTVDGTLIRTDRCHVPGPTARTDRSGRQVDLWWSGKHGCHGGNVQVIAAPDGWPLWTSPVRPGREHDTAALLHAATRAPAERGNSLLKTSFKALRRVSLCPWRIGAITAAALVLLHHAHGRTT